MRLLVDLVLREDGHGGSRRWRRYAPAEIAAALCAQGVDRDLDDLTAVIAEVLGGTREEIPGHLLEPLAAFFRSPVGDLTGDDPQIVETAILERLLVELGAGGVLFCRDLLDRARANMLLRTVLNALRNASCTGSGGRS